ncbi:MAG: single-stranded DNA-binding protein [Ruminococcaceae bacterium]|nr:single-stranded DNA-binding protein [Oscillospiraceae bacterium]
MANFNLNKVILGGRLTADPELKQTASGVSVVSFGIAVNRRFSSKDASQQQPQADFFNVTAWRATAEFVAKYFKKGSSICIVGSIQNRTWTDQQGAKHYATDIIADEVNFVDARGESAASQAPFSPDAYSAPSYSSNAASAPKFEELKTDDDLPF